MDIRNADGDTPLLWQAIISPSHAQDLQTARIKGKADVPHLTQFFFSTPHISSPPVKVETKTHTKTPTHIHTTFAISTKLC